MSRGKLSLFLVHYYACLFADFSDYLADPVHTLSKLGKTEHLANAIFERGLKQQRRKVRRDRQSSVLEPFLRFGGDLQAWVPTVKLHPDRIIAAPSKLQRFT